MGELHDGHLCRPTVCPGEDPLHPTVGRYVLPEGGSIPIDVSAEMHVIYSSRSADANSKLAPLLQRKRRLLYRDPWKDNQGAHDLNTFVRCKWCRRTFCPIVCAVI